MVKRTGQRGVPVIKIGSRWIVGFDRPSIDQALSDRGSRESFGRKVSKHKEAER